MDEQMNTMAKAENLYTPNCIRTVGGRYVNLVNPDPETFDLGDIAWALSRVPRFGGHLPRPWSVAQHSLLVASMVPQEHKLQALLHDASEAFLCDVPSPLKAHLPEYKAIEERMMMAIAKRFSMSWPLAPEVKAADMKALELEWKYIMLGERDGSRYQVGIDVREEWPRKTVATLLHKAICNARFELQHGKTNVPADVSGELKP